MLRDEENASGRRGTINWGDEREQEKGQIVLLLQIVCWPITCTSCVVYVGTVWYARTWSSQG